MDERKRDSERLFTTTKVSARGHRQIREQKENYPKLTGLMFFRLRLYLTLATEMSDPANIVKAENARTKLLKLLNESRDSCVNKRRLQKLDLAISSVTTCVTAETQTLGFTLVFLDVSIKMMKQAVTKKQQTPVIHAYARWIAALVPILTKK